MWSPDLKIGIVLLVLSLEGNTPVEILREKRWLRGSDSWYLMDFKIFILMPLASVLDLESIAEIISTICCWEIESSLRLGGGEDGIGM